jgi:hypothetical protein
MLLLKQRRYSLVQLPPLIAPASSSCPFMIFPGMPVWGYPMTVSCQAEYQLYLTTNVTPIFSFSTRCHPLMNARKSHLTWTFSGSLLEPLLISIWLVFSVSHLFICVCPLTGPIHICSTWKRLCAIAQNTFGISL